MGVLDSLIGGGPFSQPTPNTPMLDAITKMQQPAPTPVFSASMLPLSTYSDGTTGFDPHAGILGAIGSALQGARNIGQPQPMGSVSDAQMSANDVGRAGAAMNLAGLLGAGGMSISKPAGAVGAFGGARAVADAGSTPTLDAITSGITAYHGSPYSFDAFDASKVGTGEGAQAYGHGLYFAQNEAVANAYRDALAGASKGNMYEVNIAANPDHFLDHDGEWADQSQHVQDALRAVGIDHSGFAPQFSAPDPRDMFGISRQVAPTPTGGSIYKDLSAMGGRDMTMAQQAETRPVRDAAAAEFLRQAGIPGIKYMDAGSRGTGGTRNFVVFDDKNVSIMRKYGLAGLMAGAGAAGGFGLADGGDSAQAAPAR